MQANEMKDLEALALNVRERVIKMSSGGGCFLGASLSCVEIFTYLYKKHVSLTKETLKAEDRDYVFLSKGHDVPAMYGLFTEMGWLEEGRLDNHLSTEDDIYWHPNRKIPGVEFHSGSLGHLLSVATGVAYDFKLKGKKNKVCVVVGDGELNEGSNWEALLVAQAYKIDNLTVIVDRNEFQANIRTEELIPLEPLDKKFEAFGAAVQTVDGHSFEALDGAFTQIPFNTGKPSVVIAKTLRGKGLPSIQERADRWFCKFTDDEVQALLKELHGGANTNLESDTIVAR